MTLGDNDLSPSLKSPTADFCITILVGRTKPSLSVMPCLTSWSQRASIRLDLSQGQDYPLTGFPLKTIGWHVKKLD